MKTPKVKIDERVERGSDQWSSGIEDDFQRKKRIAWDTLRRLSRGSGSLTSFLFPFLVIHHDYHDNQHRLMIKGTRNSNKPY